MRPLDRPRTVSPDVTRFISPAEPDELIEVDEIDETPYVLHVPVKPPPPARFANRRKLYDDPAAPDDPDFGAGIGSQTADDSAIKEQAPAEIPRNSSHEKTAQESDSAAGDQGRSRRRRRGRGGESDAPRPPGSNAGATTKRPDGRGRPDAERSRSTGNAGHSERHQNAKSGGSDGSAPLGRDAQAGRDSTSGPASPEQGEGRRSRRRGRRRGPRPEAGDARPSADSQS